MFRAATVNETAHDRPVLRRLLFAQCWEDPLVDREALRVREGDTVLSITSGGCNVLALALLGPRRIVAADLNESQNHLLALKIAAIRSLSHRELLELVGALPSHRRSTLYRACRDTLPVASRAFWDERQDLIRSGLLGCGRYERYLAAFRGLLRLVEGRRTLEDLFEARDREERARFYRDRWDTPTWRLMFRTFFSRTVLGRFGLDPAFFTWVEQRGGFGAHFLELAKHALIELEPRTNPYVSWITLGRFANDECLPPWLQERNLERLRSRVGCIEIATVELGQALARESDDSIDAFNLSNIFEWVSPAIFRQLLGEVHRTGRDGARVSYRSLLARRITPPEEANRFRRHAELAERLRLQDRAFVYSHLEIASVAKAAARKEECHEDRAAGSLSDPLVDADRIGLRDAGRTAARRG